MSRKQSSTLNAKLLRDVQGAIMANPQQFDMGAWRDGDVMPGAEKCSASACIAGWTVVLGRRQRLSTLHHEQIKALARELLGIRTQDEAQRLFFLSFWPVALASRYVTCPKTWSGYQSNALVACERIAVFVNSQGQF